MELIVLMIAIGYVLDKLGVKAPNVEKTHRHRWTGHI